MKYTLIVELVVDDGPEYYVARHPEFLACTAVGKTDKEAIDNLAEMTELQLEMLSEQGLPAPEPAVIQVGARHIVCAEPYDTSS